MADPTFETQVLVGLEEIKGDVKAIKVTVDDSKLRLDKHETQISELKKFVYRMAGGVATIAVVAPFVVPRIGG